MTAYGEEWAATLPGTSSADRSRFEATAQRALTRLRNVYAGGPYGFWITPALSQGIRAAIPGLDHYADAASYSGLTLVGLNWALEQMPPAGPPAGPIAADSPGSHRLAAGNSAVEVVRTPGLWYAVKQGPGVFVKGVGDYSVDLRYDSGLVGLEAIDKDGTPGQILPSRPHSLAPGDRAEPLLHRGRLLPTMGPVRTVAGRWLPDGCIASTWPDHRTSRRASPCAIRVATNGRAQAPRSSKAPQARSAGPRSRCRLQTMVARVILQPARLHCPAAR